MALLQDLINLGLSNSAGKSIAELFLIGRRIRASFPHGTTLDPAQIRLQETIVSPAGEPIPTNKMFNAVKISSHFDVTAEEPSYGIDQEYTLLK